MHHNKSMYITNVEKEGPFLKIWGQVDKKSSLEVEEALLRASERFDEGKYKVRQNSLEVGILCCAKYVDEKYYRARVASIAFLTDGMVEVNFVDYGNKDVVPVGNLRTLECFNPSFVSLPPLSTPFILAEVVCIGGEWNDQIVEQISKEIRYMEHNYVIIAQAIRYYFIKVFVHDIDLGLHLVRQSLMQSTSIQTQEAVLLAMIPRKPQVIPSPNQSLLQYKSFTLEPNSQHEVYVSYITDGPCHFSVQLKKYESALAQLMREINSIPLKPLEELPILGTVCLAKCVEDNHICRAVVTSEVDSQYKLFYVDFGNTELVPPENLYQMAFKFIIPKIMAIRLSLAGIEKTSMTLEMQCAFKKFVDNRLLMMEVLPAAKKMALPKCRIWDPDTNTDVIEVLNRAAKCAYPDPVALHKGFTQIVKVSFVYSCNRFYVQLKSKEVELNKLMEDLQVYCNSNHSSYLDKSKVGQPCCALFSFDQKWYRSLITEIEGDNAKVRYIDFGNEEFVPVDTLKVVEGEYLTVLRPQAIECCLNGYQNMTEDPERDIKLEELILEQEFTMKVIDSIGSITLVDLMDAANTTVTALLLEAIMAQKKVLTAPPVQEQGRFEGGGKRQSAGEEWRSGDDRNSKPYYQHDDRRSPRGQNWKEKTDDNNTSWRQNARKRNDSNSTESSESWRQDNKGFKNRKENDWNDRPPSNNNFRKEKGFRGRSDNSENERASRNSNRYSEGNYWNNRKGFRDHNGEWGGAKEDGYNPSRPPRNQNENWAGAKEDGRNQNKSSRNANGEWSDSNSKGERTWKDNNQGFKKRYDRENKEWGNSDNGDFKGRNRSENTDWNNKTEKNDWNNKNEKTDWNNKNSAGGGDWVERKPYKDRNINREEWNANKGGAERKFGDRNRDNDRGDYKKKPFRREASEISPSGSEKSFGKGLRTSSRNDNRTPRTDRKLSSKSSDNSWNVSAVPSVIDSAPNDATFKSIDVNGKQGKVTISWFHNPCSFFCQLVESQEPFKKLMEDIQQAYKGRPAGSCVKGAPIVGLFPEDNVLYRARVIDVLDAQYKIHYVDFGNVSVVDKVWPIENRFMELPMQGIPCGLDSLQPVADDWPNPDNYSEYFEREDLDCNFLSLDETGRYRVNLTVDNEDVTQRLVNDSLAKYWETTAVNVEIALLVGQQLRAMLRLVNSPSDFALVLQSGVTLNCSMHNLATAAEISENLLKQHVDQILIVYVDDLVEDRLEVTLYDSTGTKLNVIEPDEGAFDTVDPLCPHLVVSSTLRGFVSHVNENSVVVQPSECAQNVEYILEQMYEYYENMPPADAPLVPEEESVYAVKSNDGNWYRGRVTAFDDDKASVTYVDYGNSEEVAFSRLRDLTPEMLLWDAMAVLVNVKVKTSDFLEQDVIATIYYGETGWEGELNLVEPLEQPLPPQVQLEAEHAPVSEHAPESEHAAESSSVQFSDTSTVDIAQATPETTLTQTGETPEVSHAYDDAASYSGVENENVRPAGTTPVVLSHVDSPSDFYIQLVDSQTAIAELQLRLQDLVGEMTHLESASVGGLCAAPYSVDQQWYRSQILDADDDITTVRFIDYGNTDVIDNNATHIKTLSAELLALEEYATRCRLKIKPSEEDWPKSALERFEQLTDVDNLTVEFVDQDEKTNYVELYADGANVKDVLIGENLALFDDVALEGKLTGFVSHINSPSEFWVQLESCCAELEWIAEQLSNAASFRDMEDLTPGSLCAAMFPDDEMWYRARILSNTVAGLEVLFLDYGNSCVCSNLKQLPEHLVMAPPLTQKCGLQKPEGTTGWSAEASRRFSELCANGQTIFVVRKLTTGETSIVELLTNGEDVSCKLLVDTESTTKEIDDSKREEKTEDEVVPEIPAATVGEVSKENEKKEVAIEVIEEYKVVPEVVVETVSESTEENKKNEDIKHNDEKEIKEEKNKLEVSTKNITPVDCNEKPLEKLEEKIDKGKSHHDVEYLSDNTVRLYLDENKINNELKELLSPILKEKTSSPVSVIATIEIITDSPQKQDEELVKNSDEDVPCESQNTSSESSCLESNTSKSTTLDSESREFESVVEKPHDCNIEMIESLVDNIDVQEEISFSKEDRVGQDPNVSIEKTIIVLPLTVPNAETEDAPSSLVAVSRKETVLSDASKHGEHATDENEVVKFATVSEGEVVPFETSERSICVRKSTDDCTIDEEEIDREQDTHVMVICKEDEELDVALEQAADNFITQEDEIYDNITQQEKTINTETKTYEDTTQQQIGDVTCEISTIISKQEMNNCDIGQQETEDTERENEMINILSTEHMEGEYTKNDDGDEMSVVQTQESEIIESCRKDEKTDDLSSSDQETKQELNEKNSQNICINPVVDSTESKSIIEEKLFLSQEMDEVLSGEERDSPTGVICEGNLEESQQQSKEKQEELLFTASQEVACEYLEPCETEEKCETNGSQKIEHPEQTDENSPTGVICEGNVEESQQQTVETQNAQKELLFTASEEVACEYLETHETEENSATNGSQKIEHSEQNDKNSPTGVICEGNLEESHQQIVEKQNTQKELLFTSSQEVACEYLELHETEENSASNGNPQIEHPEQTDKNSPTGVICEGNLEESQQQTVEKQNTQKGLLFTASQEVACEYIELHETEENSTSNRSQQILLEHPEQTGDTLDKTSMSACNQQETEKSDSNILKGDTSELPVCGFVAGESETSQEVCPDPKSSEISQQNPSAVNLKSKDNKSCATVEFQEIILTSFSAPTISKNAEVATKLSPTKILPKSRTDSLEKLDAKMCEEK